MLYLGPGVKENQSFFFTQFVMKDRIVDNSRVEDPREALLKLDAETKKNPLYLGTMNCILKYFLMILYIHVFIFYVIPFYLY